MVCTYCKMSAYIHTICQTLPSRTYNGMNDDLVLWNRRSCNDSDESSVYSFTCDWPTWNKSTGASWTVSVALIFVTILCFCLSCTSLQEAKPEFGWGVSNPTSSDFSAVQTTEITIRWHQVRELPSYEIARLKHSSDHKYYQRKLRIVNMCRSGDHTIILVDCYRSTLLHCNCSWLSESVFRNCSAAEPPDSISCWAVHISQPSHQTLDKELVQRFHDWKKNQLSGVLEWNCQICSARGRRQSASRFMLNDCNFLSQELPTISKCFHL